MSELPDNASEQAVGAKRRLKAPPAAQRERRRTGVARRATDDALVE